MRDHSSEFKISEAEVLGLEVGQTPIPRVLRAIEDRPLTFYRIFLRYKGNFKTGSKKKFAGRCILNLYTKFFNDEGLVMVKGKAVFKPFKSVFFENVNYLPKKEIECQQLYDLLAHYVSALYWPLDGEYVKCNPLIKNSLFTCNRKAVAMVEGYNSDGTLDKVSVEMSLFKKI